RHRDVIAIAVSGQKKAGLRISTYRHPRGAGSSEPLMDRERQPLDRLKSPSEYRHLYYFDPAILRSNIERLMAHTREVHNFLRDYAKVTEAEKPLVISAILLALRHPPFRKAWNVTPD